MIDIPCVVTCDECGVRVDARLRRTAVTTGWMAFIPGSPSEELTFPGEETTTWVLSDVGRTFCDVECEGKFQAKQDKERAERAMKETKR